MKRNFALQQRYPAFYNHRVLDGRRLALNLTKHDVARLAGEPKENVRNVFRGTAKNHSVYPVCVALGMDWERIHDLTLEESDFHLAVINGNGSKSAG